ncbi:FmdB family zinc ribbon protein [Tsukamurella soli]|uniref:Putative regulatory protein FmdB zinc ribbon domain-containing protein n=1 Tax=Tsukamurella soli TaxID=644556 RepID=A0ABP8JXG6_9ACTN
MPTYLFRCPRCGAFERAYPMADVPARAPCPACPGVGLRRPTSPALIAPGSAVVRLIDATERTAHEPDVVGAPPRPTTTAAAGPHRRPAITRNPLHHKLPRP